MATLLLGAALTPLGEELAFRGVITTALGRYGPWVAVIGSATIFALVHGLNPVLPVAFSVGVAAALLLRRSGSVWPGVLLHGAPQRHVGRRPGRPGRPQLSSAAPAGAFS